MQRIGQIELRDIELRALHEGFCDLVAMVFVMVMVMVMVLGMTAAMALVSFLVAMALAAFVTAAGAVIAACAMLVIASA